MAVHIIIDGYNLIRRSPALSVLDRQDLQSGREALIENLVSYKRIKRHAITVVFDGSGPSLLYPSRDTVGGIKILFSRGGETADTLIKRMVAKEGQKALVVSSDREIVDFARKSGAATIGAGDFGDKLAQAAYMDVKGHVDTGTEDNGWSPTTKKKGPRRRLSKRRRRNRARVSKL